MSIRFLQTLGSNLILVVLAGTLVASPAHVHADNRTGPDDANVSLQLAFPSHRPTGLYGDTAVADLDDDGHVDIVTASSAPPGYCVAMGLPSGAFAEPRCFGDHRALQVRLADFNEDEREDLLVIYSFTGGSDNETWILPGRGDGTFSDTGTLVHNSYGFEPEISDLDGDHHLDIIVNTSAYLGNGDGTFQSVGKSTPVVAWLGHLDNDGIIDIASRDVGSGDGGNIHYNFGRGDGTFIRGARYSFFSIYTQGSVVFEDLNGDGLKDFLALTDEDLGVHLAVGVLDFLEEDFVTYPLLEEHAPVRSRPGRLALFDLNEDEILDVVVSNFGVSTVSVLLGRGDGTFSSANQYGVSTEPWRVHAFSVGNDTALSLLVDAEGGSVLLRGDGSGAFFGWERVVAETFINPRDIEIADLDGDGFADYVTVADLRDNEIGRLAVIWGAASALAGPSTEIQVPPGPLAIAIGDVDNDARPDIVSTSYRASKITVIGSKAGRRFELMSSISVESASKSLFGAVELADLNHDGNLDVVAMNNNRLEILLGHGDGSFDRRTLRDYLSGVRSLGIEDMDRDGDVDIVAAGSDIWVFRGTGTGGFEAPQRFAAPVEARFLTIDDVNADGRPDVLCSGRSSLSEPQRLGVLLNRPFCAGDCDGNNTVEVSELIRAVRLLLGFPETQCAAADFDGDGSIVVAEVIRGVRNTLESCPSPSLGAPLSTTSIRIGEAIRTADIDRDGNVDVIGTSFGILRIARGRGDGSFEEPARFGQGTGGEALAVKDLNRDGLPDIVAGHSSTGTQDGGGSDAALSVFLQRRR